MERLVRRRMIDRPDSRSLGNGLADLERRSRPEEPGVVGDDLPEVVPGDDRVALGDVTGKETEIPADVEQAVDTLVDDVLEDLLVVREFGRNRRDPFLGGGHPELSRETAVVPLVGSVFVGLFGQEEVSSEGVGKAARALVVLAVDDVGSMLGLPVWRSTRASAAVTNSQSWAAIRWWRLPLLSPGQIRFMFGLTLSNCSGVV